VSEIALLRYSWFRQLQRIAYALLWVFVSMGFVICLAWAALHWFVFARVNDYRQTLEQKASQSLGVSVQIGEIQNLGGWWVPWFAVKDVSIQDQQGRQALDLPQVTISVSAYSLVRGQFNHLVVEQPRLSIRRDSEGQIWIAGMALPKAQNDDSGASADWFFSLPEFAVRNGDISWQDGSKTQLANEMLSLHQVDLVIRNFANTHQIRLDFTPPSHWGERLSLRGRFYQLPWSRAGDLTKWSGQAYAQMPWVDLSELRKWVDLGQDVTLQQGRGELRVWSQIDDGQPRSITLDSALDTVQARLGKTLEPLLLEHLQGRVQFNWRDDQISLSTKELQFETAQGERWPASNMTVSWQGDDFASGNFTADVLDISAISQINQRLPIPLQWREGLQHLKPQGQITGLQANWKKSSDSGYEYNVKARAHQLAIEHDGADAQWKKWPSFHHLDADIELDQTSGKAKLQMAQSQIELPDVLHESLIAIDSLQAQLKWKRQSDIWSIDIANAEIKNQDATAQVAGQFELPNSTHPFGYADLSGSFKNANASQVYKYLPVLLDQKVREYLKAAIVEGEASTAKWQVKGDLKDFPFKNKKGVFNLTADVQKGTVDYAPASIAAKKSAPWPRLQDIQGQLVLDQQSLQFQGGLKIEKANQVVWDKVQVNINDLAHTVVEVAGQGKGPLMEVADAVAKTALNDVTHGAIAQLLASGDAQYKLELKLPISNFDETQVNGSINLHDNDVQFAQGIPVLSRAQGEIHFTHSAVDIHNVKGTLLGSDALVDGRLAYDGSSGALPLKISGIATAEGLKQARELGFISRIGQRLSGKTNFEARVGLRRGQPEFLISSDLRGIAANFPAPLNKVASQVTPLRIELALSKDSQAPNSRTLQDQLKISVGKILQVNYLRDISGTQTRVLRGQITLANNASDVALSTGNGVNLNVQLPIINLDEWDSVQESISGVALSKAIMKSNRLAVNTENAGDAGLMYFPTSMAVRTDALNVAQRDIHHLIATGIRVNDSWYIDVNAQEAAGYLQVRPSAGNAPAQLYARLNYLTLESADANRVQNIMGESNKPMPSLDVVVNDFTLKGKKFGRMQIEAVNQPKQSGTREWHVNKLSFTMPEAIITATGVWNPVPGPDMKTTLNFQMQVSDGGGFLTRMGMPGVIKSGQGKLAGEIYWAGSPMAFDYPSLGGKFNMDIEKGQFLKSDPGVGRLLGVLSLQALPRRLTLDFKDVFSEGFAFDFIRGDGRIEKGIVFTNNLQMKGVSGGALMEGSADLVNETQDLKVVITPDINAGAASLYIATINPLIGLTTYLTQLVLSKSVNKAATSEVHITGTWRDPQYVKVN
jgi:uncharacterized protein (TIGR02099 family)